MKAIVENPLSFYDEQNYSQSMREFARIIQDIVTSKNRKELISNLEYSSKILGQINNFKYGFGGSHMWVKQLSRDRKETGKQVIFVNLE